jgi:23S rRNA pseudouridine2605 synthase
MAKHRPHGPKGHSSGRPKSGQRTLSGARPGGSGPRPRPGGGPGSARPRPGGGPHGHKKHGPGTKPGAGPQRRDHRAGAAEARPRANREPGKPERLQKVLAQAGLGSRRGCEELIVQGRVTVDGQVVRELGTRVEPSARIAVDGEPIRLEALVYYAVNKPEGYVSTNSDPSGRPRVVDLVAEIPQRVYTVGRLDEDSTGLMILTNDGELANRLAHPKFGVEKLYQALVAGLPTPESLSKLTEGVWLSDGKVRAKRVRIAGRRGQATLLELVLAEGKKREIRRMLAKLGHKVMSLHRVAIGPIAIKGLPPGESRPLTRHEVELLHKVASGESVSVPGFPDVEPSRAHRGPRKAPQAGRPTTGGGARHGGPQAERRRYREDGEGQERGPSRRPGTGRPAGPARAGGRPPRPRVAEAEAAPPVQGPAGSPSVGGPRRGPAPHRPKSGGHAAPPAAHEPQAGPRGPKRPAGPGPQAQRPPARPVQQRDEEPGPRRRIIGLQGQAAAALGGTPAERKRPMARKPKPPRSALGPRPGRLRPPQPKGEQDDEQ